MSEVLHKFPSTPHLVWQGEADVRDDKVLTPAQVEVFLSGPVLVEEKVDGANLGLSFDATGRLRRQNRGNWLEGKLSGQWERLRGWTAEHEARLRDVLPQDHILFGEWCYATHSVRYDRLPDWFLVFDVYDRKQRRFWSASRRDALAAAARFAVVPRVASGIFVRSDLLAMLDGPSALGDGPCEGLYLRREEGDWLLDRAKIVRPDFTQAISEHWSRKSLVLNAIRQTPVPSE